MKVNERILNHLEYAETFQGRVGCKVNPTGENKNNLAWIVIKMDRESDLRLAGYEIDYIELDEKYQEEINGLDYDLYIVSETKVRNITNVEELEQILLKWVNDFSNLQPIANVKHPFY